MREIKFKFLFGYMIDNPFFIKDGKKYLEKVILNLEQLMECEYEYSIPSYFTLIAKLQYTGLKDKNGVEIYEGDVVECTGWNNIDKEWKKYFKVSFDDGCFCLEDNDGKFYGVFKTTVVIGNIYENTELLETT